MAKKKELNLGPPIQSDSMLKIHSTHDLIEMCRGIAIKHREFVKIEIEIEADGDCCVSIENRGDEDGFYYNPAIVVESDLNTALARLYAKLDADERYCVAVPDDKKG